MNFVGKNNNKEKTLAEICKEIDENPSISFNDKAQAKMKAFADSMKTKAN